MSKLSAEHVEVPGKVVLGADEALLNFELGARWGLPALSRADKLPLPFSVCVGEESLHPFGIKSLAISRTAMYWQEYRAKFYNSILFFNSSYSRSTYATRGSKIGRWLATISYSMGPKSQQLPGSVVTGSECE